jgi:glutamine synthetase
METERVRTLDDVRALLDERQLHHVRVGVFDIDGILRGKYMSREKLLSAVEKGAFGFCDVVLGWDSADLLYDNVRYTGWHTGYPDAPVRILPETCRSLPLEGEGMVLFLGEFGGEAENLCPRALLRRVLDRARGMGFEVRAGFEYEFFVFNETPHSLRSKNFRDLQPLAPGSFGYSMLRSSVEVDLYRDILRTCEEMGLPIEGLHEEAGPGVLEAALQASDGLRAADNAALFKTFVKVLAQKREKTATFMAKWSSEWPGLSGHIHVSLTDTEGNSVFCDRQQADGMSTTMRRFLGGQQALMPELLSLVAPTVNSFTRLVPGFWAPTDSSWGIDNRTCALRVIPGSEKAQRVEYRVAGADCNPYLGLAAAVASGLHGIEAQLEPQKLSVGNAYEQKFPRKLRLPRTLGEAAQRLDRSSVGRDWFGDAFVDHFVATRRWEESQFRQAVTDWELKRYFEII